MNFHSTFATVASCGMAGGCYGETPFLSHAKTRKVPSEETDVYIKMGPPKRNKSPQNSPSPKITLIIMYVIHLNYACTILHRITEELFPENYHVILSGQSPNET